MKTPASGTWQLAFGFRSDVNTNVERKTCSKVAALKNFTIHHTECDRECKRPKCKMPNAASPQPIQRAHMRGHGDFLGAETFGRSSLCGPSPRLRLHHHRANLRLGSIDRSV